MGSMLWPLRETLELIEPHVPRPLVSASSFAHTQYIAALLPTATSSCYWECRLAADTPQVDFLTCIATSDGGREVFATQSARTGLPGSRGATAVWNQACEFLRQWADPTSALYEQVPLIWLEFDHVDEPIAEVLLPSVSFCVDSAYAERRSWAHYVSSHDPQNRGRIAEKGLPLLFGSPLSPQQQEALLTCFASLPVGGRIIHLSAMIARHPAVVKVYASIPQNHLFPYLNRIGWPGPFSELTDILARFCTPDTVDHHRFIDLTLGETVMPKLGIAFAQQQIANLPDKDPTRRTLLDHCVQAGLCTAEKREALRAWPGNFRALFPGEQWLARFHIWLDVKIVYQPTLPLEAKGYVGFRPQFSWW